MIPLRSVKISGHVYNLAAKCHATEKVENLKEINWWFDTLRQKRQNDLLLLSCSN
jgi:hypothetical protein